MTPQSTRVATETESSTRAPDCKQCGRLVVGRRRNGFCSDRCRMAAHRQLVHARKKELLSTLKKAVEDLEHLPEWRVIAADSVGSTFDERFGDPPSADGRISSSS